MPIEVLLAEDHIIVRECLKACLEQEGFTVVGEADNGLQAVQLAKELQPDVAIIDLAMPVLNGLAAAPELLRAVPRIKVILLTMYSDEQYVLEALRAGVRGYVLKNQAVRDLVQAIREVLRGSFYLSPRVSRTVVEAYLQKKDISPDPLTPREREVLQLVAEGKTTKEIASLLGVSVKTAECHRSRIMDKLDLHQTAGLVRYAIRRGLIQP